MTILKTVEELKEFVKTDYEIGFVATMGALHQGHISLINRCVSENKISIVSIFVNPTQFSPTEDLDKYPKKESADLEICSMCGASAVFMPEANDMYFDNEITIKAPTKLSSILEGKSRPGHFDGVLMVLNKFFNLIKPTRAYFGKKDAQQLVVVQNMVKLFFMNIKIIPCEIVRDSNGLALSSRNEYLSDIDKQTKALSLSKSLFCATNLIKDGITDVSTIKNAMSKEFRDIEIDYIEIVDRDFNQISQIEFGNTIILVAAYVGSTRLLDNIWI